MSDDQQNVDAGSETSGDTGVQTEQVETTDTTATEQSDTADSADTTQVDSTNATTETVQTDTAADAGGDTDQLQAGSPCTCPDGRAGTLWSDGANGFVCLPNQG